MRAPAKLFLTVHPVGSQLVGDLVQAASGKPVAGRRPRSMLTSSAGRSRSMSRIRPGIRATARCAWRWGLGCGTPRATGICCLTRLPTPLIPAAPAPPPTLPRSSTSRFRTGEPAEAVTAETGAVTSPAWWRDQQQGAGLAAGDISPFFANVPFADLAARLTDNSRVPVTGAMNRILASHLEPAQGAN